MTKSKILVLLTFITLSACQRHEEREEHEESGQYKQYNRQCPAFGSELADNWSTALNVEDTVQYISETGDTISLVLMSRNDSQPYIGTYYSIEPHHSGENKVKCHTYSTRRYAIDRGEADILITISQSFLAISDIEEQTSLGAQLRSEAPGSNSIDYGYNLFLGENAKIYYETVLDADADPANSNPRERFIKGFKAGNTRYRIAVESTFKDTTTVKNSVSDPNSDIAISRIVFAEGGGLVEFEKLNGEVYSRQ